MANTIALFKKYIDKLDEVYFNASKTSILDSDAATVRQGANANEIIIPVLDMDGLGNYDRNTGYVDGSVNLTHETKQFNYDRARTLDIDAMDNEETAGVAFGRLSSEFIRTKVVPEMDALRFAKYCEAPGISEVEATYATGEEVLKAIVTAQSKMDEDEVPQENRYLFITPTLYNLAISVDNTKSKAVLDDFAGIIKVPQRRFYTAIDLKDGKSGGQTAGGYAKAMDGADINFMIVEKSALIQYSKHKVDKVITPDANQKKDAWAFYYRAYGIAEVYDNKTAGIYLSHKANA